MTNVNHQQQLEQKQFFFRKGLEKTWDAQKSGRAERPWKTAVIIGGSLAAALILLLLLTGAFAKKPSVYVDGQRYVVTNELVWEPDAGYFYAGETFYSQDPKKEAANLASDWLDDTTAAKVYRNPDSDRKVYLHLPGSAWVEARKK